MNFKTLKSSCVLIVITIYFKIGCASKNEESFLLPQEISNEPTPNESIDQSTKGSGFLISQEVTSKDEISEQKTVIKEESDSFDLPQAAALQGYPTGTRNTPLGGRNPSLGISQSFHNLPRNPTCGLCSRERNQCQIISGIFTRDPLPYGYSLVTSIPVGVCNVTIVELKASKNFFALRRPDSVYVLNGNWKIQSAGSYSIAGTTFRYNLAEGTGGETLESPGPLLEPIDLMIIKQSPSPGIKYEYRVPISDIMNQPSRGHSSTNTAHLPFGINANKIGRSQQTNVRNSLNNGRTIVTGQGIVPYSRQQHPLLIPNQANKASGSPFTGNSAGSIPFYTGNDKLPLHTRNWGASFTPLRESNQPSLKVGQPSIFPLNNQDNGKDASSFPRTRFPGVLNTEPRKVSVPLAEDDVSIDSEAKLSSLRLLSSSFTPRTPSIVDHAGVSSDPSSKYPPHHSRHNHGLRNGATGLSVDSTPDSASASIGYPNRDKAKGNMSKKREKKRRIRKKGKKRKGRRKGRFQWVYKGLTECSKPCAGGNQTSVISCVRRKKKKIVSNKHCLGLPKQEIKTISCNLKPCPAKWVPGPWSSCSTSCGIGFQTRTLSCKQEVSQTLTIMVPEGACLSHKEEIEISQICNLRDCPKKEPHWQTDEWSPCSKTCGIGFRIRGIKCFANGLQVNDSFCLEVSSRPDDQKECDMGSCATDMWFFSEWSDTCSETCGEGEQIRSVFCGGTDSSGFENCVQDKKPESSRSCMDNSGCGGTWFAGPWSKCNLTCGSGRETRIVLCLKANGNKWKQASYTDCSLEDRPSESRACILESCQPEWFMSDWGDCSNPCKGGIREREVKCYDTNHKPSIGCSPILRPSTREICSTEICESKKDELSSRELLSTSTIATATTQKKSIIEVAKENMEDIMNYTKKHNTESNELHREENYSVGVISGKEEQGDQSATDVPVVKKEEKENKRNKKKENSKNETKTDETGCIDRMKNCELVFRARLCPLKYYNEKCCASCSVSRTK